MCTLKGIVRKSHSLQDNEWLQVVKTKRGLKCYKLQKGWRYPDDDDEKTIHFVSIYLGSVEELEENIQLEMFGRGNGFSHGTTFERELNEAFERELNEMR